MNIRPQRFIGPIGAKPATLKRRKPTVEQITAMGEALPHGTHHLTPEQQITWFGGNVFAAPVRWKSGEFLVGKESFSPTQVRRAVQRGDQLGGGQ